MCFQYARRCRWLLWLSGALVLSSLASTKEASSFRHALGVASEDQLNRQLSVNNPPVLDFNSIDEERALPQWADALAAYDKFVETSEDYKGWMKTLGFPIKERTLKKKAFKTVFPILLQKQTDSQLRHLFHDPGGDFWDMTYKGKTLGLLLLQYWNGNGASDIVIMERMLQADSNHRNMLNDDLMLDTWISFTDSRTLQFDTYVDILDGFDSSNPRKDVLHFFLKISENSGNPNIKKIASKHLNEWFEKFYKWELNRQSVVTELEIEDAEVEKMEGVLRRYSDFVDSRDDDKHVLEKIVIAQTEDKEEAVRLENDLYNKWVTESWIPRKDTWSLPPEEFQVLIRLNARINNGKR